MLGHAGRMRLARRRCGLFVRLAISARPRHHPFAQVDSHGIEPPLSTHSCAWEYRDTRPRIRPIRARPALCCQPSRGRVQAQPSSAASVVEYEESQGVHQ